MSYHSFSTEDEKGVKLKDAQDIDLASINELFRGGLDKPAADIVWNDVCGEQQRNTEFGLAGLYFDLSSSIDRLIQQQ